ncbi:hypothetical protein K491DRAFT_585996 [Lophiostoma macrostomum CBS 122681]|uniref:Uncharacterized protein n=1 Tax=Lophiostoma macrostomum CBS 122681 TaxID=1314788 RepID=A0A6A6TQH4_9PLEO|nr:hypothetical protein K491DRAFT_585996 [Lophiostoma macrostomum CBS 122681]
MSEPQQNAFTLLESSFKESPNLRSHKSLRRRREDLYSFVPAAAPLKPQAPDYDDETLTQFSSHDPTPLASPGALNKQDTGLPPTPPSNSSDEPPPATFSPPPHVDGVVASLMSKQPSLRTPLNQRSPPTPDPSPPRTNSSRGESAGFLERPPIFAYPSSRAESFKTAREDQFSTDGSDYRSETPLADRLSTVDEERGLGLAFERSDSDVTPTSRSRPGLPPPEIEESKRAPTEDFLDADDIPDREWNTDLMRNITVRKRRAPKSSPQKVSEPASTTTPPITGSPRRSSSLRERVEASKNSPHSPSIEGFAQSIGWPTEDTSTPRERLPDNDSKRLSVSSATSTVVEAMVIVTPPQRRRTLRHSGKNLAYRETPVSSAEQSPVLQSHRNSLSYDEVPLHRLVHKRASINIRKNRISSESSASGMDRSISSPLSARKQSHDSTAYTLAHQDSVRRVLQPAAEMLSRSNSLSRPYPFDRSHHKRISSAPEPAIKISLPGPRTFLEISPPDSPKVTSLALMSPTHHQQARPPSPVFKSYQSMPVSPKVRKRDRDESSLKSPMDVNKSLPDLPVQSTDGFTAPEEGTLQNHNLEPQDHHPSDFHDAVSEQPAETKKASPGHPESTEQSPWRRRGSSADSTRFGRRGSLSSRGRSEERIRSSTSRDRTTASPATILRSSLDRVPTEDIPRRSHEWRSLHVDDHRRVSFDQSTIRSDEHAMARHLFAQTTPFSTTPFSQFSDTPIEVSEATAVSIFPHNNHSLLVVQQGARASTLPVALLEVSADPHMPSTENKAPEMASSALLLDVDENDGEQTHPQNPVLTVEPSTPPMQISLPVPEAVDSPLKNPRAAPEPPVIKFIPPTPAEELERQLVPGPPKRSDSHPQRRLSLVQRARRYSDNLISPLLTRTLSSRGRYASDSFAHENPRVPTVSDEDGSLHPFWRPRGFWDGFEDSDDESDDDILPAGGDTSDVEDLEPESPKKLGTLSRRLTNSFKGSGGFLIGNSLGVERSGTNKRRPHVELPSKRTSKSPKILVQPPTLPFRSSSPRIEKRSSGTSMHSSNSLERSRRGRRESWRSGKRIPGVKLQVQYIGLSGVRERMRERSAEKRRNKIRKSIGSRIYMEDGMSSS